MNKIVLVLLLIVVFFFSFGGGIFYQAQKTVDQVTETANSAPAISSNAASTIQILHSNVVQMEIFGTVKSISGNTLTILNVANETISIPINSDAVISVVNANTSSTTPKVATFSAIKVGSSVTVFVGLDSQDGLSGNAVTVLPVKSS